MSTNINQAASGSFTDVAHRRKASTMCEDDLTQAQEEYTRSVKRCTRSDEDAEKIRMRLAKISPNVAGKKRVRHEGQAVTLRKKFLESLRNVPVQAYDAEGCPFAFTFTPVPFRGDVPAIAMEVVEEVISTCDSDLMVVQPNVIPAQQVQVSMSIDGSQDVDPEYLIATSASIPIVDMEMEDSSKHVHALEVAAHTTDDRQAMASVDMNTFIPNFLARVAAVNQTHFANHRQTTVRSLRAPSALKVTKSFTPSARSQRPEWYSSTPRAGGSSAVPDELFGLPSSPIEETRAGDEFVAAYNGQPVSTTPFNAPPSTTPINTPPFVHPFALFEDEDISDSTTESVVLDALRGTREGSPELVEDVDILDSSAPLEASHDVASPPQDEFFLAPFVEIREKSAAEGEEVSNSETDLDEWLASFARDEELPAAVSAGEHAVELLAPWCPVGSPVPVVVEEMDDIFGPVVPYSRPVEYEVQTQRFELFNVTNSEVFSTNESEEIVEDSMMREQVDDQFFSLPPSPSPSSMAFEAVRCGRTVFDAAFQVPNTPPLVEMGSNDSSAYASDSDEFSMELVPERIATSARWAFRESRVVQDVDEDDMVVVVDSEEAVEPESVPAVTDACFGSLVAHLDKWSCKDRIAPPAAAVDVLMASESDVWYDAMDDTVTPAISSDDIRMVYTAPSAHSMHDLINLDSFSAPPSPARSPAGFSGGNFELHSPPRAITGDLGSPYLLDSPLVPSWNLASPAAGSPLFSPQPDTGSPLFSPQLDTDVFGNLLGSDATSPTMPADVLIPDLDDGSSTLRRDVRLAWGTLAGLQFSDSFRLSEDDLSTFSEAPSYDLINLDVSQVPTPIPSPTRIIPGHWGQSFQSSSDLLL